MTILTKKSQAKQETASFNKKNWKNSFKKRISWEPEKLSLKGVEMKDLTLDFEVWCSREPLKEWVAPNG